MRVPISSVADPDPGSGAFWTPGSGTRDPDLGSGNLDTIQYLNSLMRIRDRIFLTLDPGSGKTI
jgi:hypothetical protein